MTKRTVPIFLLLLVFVIAVYYALPNLTMPSIQAPVHVVSEESVIIDVVKHASPAVVTVGITQTQQGGITYFINPFDFFAPLVPQQGTPQKIEQDIGSGFIVDKSGFIVTNKHVVSDMSATYRVITSDNKVYPVIKIYRDPANDLAVLKINPTADLSTVQLGDSNTIQVGQLAIAIGTALGQFRSTVTTGVVSGLGRGITAGDPFAGAAEQLDNVIQTSAAINPGNSGGPLLNSSGQVVGMNVAESVEGQNIGFALPVNVVKSALSSFRLTGQL